MVHSTATVTSVAIVNARILMVYDMVELCIMYMDFCVYAMENESTLP